MRDKSTVIHTSLEEWHEFRVHPTESRQNKIAQQNGNLVLQQVTCEKLSIKETQLEDARMGGFLGLTKAIRRYDPDTGNAFSSFACPYIINEARRWVARYSHSVTIPRAWGEMRSRIRRVERFKKTELRKIYLSKYGVVNEEAIAPSREQLAANVGISVQEYDQIQQAWGDRNACSLPCDDDGNTIDIPDHRYPDGDDEPTLSVEQLVKNIEGLPLPSLSKDILRYRVYRLTLKEIAKRLKVTEQQAEAVRDEAIAALFLFQRNETFEHVLVVTQQLNESNSIKPARLSRIRYLASLGR